MIGFKKHSDGMTMWSDVMPNYKKYDSRPYDNQPNQSRENAKYVGEQAEYLCMQPCKDAENR